jgi:hypothetical protein
VGQQSKGHLKEGENAGIHALRLTGRRPFKLLRKIKNKRKKKQKTPPKTIADEATAEAASTNGRDSPVQFKHSHVLIYWTTVPSPSSFVELNKIGSLTVKPLQFPHMAPWTLMALYLSDMSSNETLLFARRIMVISTTSRPGRPLFWGKE